MLRSALPALAACLLLASARAHEPLQLVRAQTVYVPVYSEVLHGDLDRQGRPARQLLSALVSVRNTDSRNALRVTSARYFDSNGRMLREFIQTPRTVPPLGALDLFVERRESEGGAGASFLIKWQSDAAVNPPFVEAVHVDLHSLRPLSFTTFGRPVQPQE
jgi:hypothetical protein